MIKHAYGTLIAEVPATCENGGTKAHYYCETCETYFDGNKNKVEFADLAISASGHAYGTLVAEVPATCETAGTKAHYYCEACETYFDEDKEEVAFEDLAIPATGHEFGEWEQTKEPTTTEEGERERKCLHCDEAEKETIPILPVEGAMPNLIIIFVVLLIVVILMFFVFTKN